MKPEKDTVTISLKKYHSLIDAEEIAIKNADIELCHRFEKEKKYTLTIDWYFCSPAKVLLTDDEALYMAIQGKKEQLEKEINHFKETTDKLTKQWKRLDSLKWYHLLFGIKENKTAKSINEYDSK